MVEEIAKIVEDWGNERAEMLRENIASKGHNANGDTFAASFTPLEVEIGEDYLTWKLEGPEWYDVINSGGKRWTKKMPPINPIMEWLAHKGIKAKVTKKSSIVSAIKGKSPKSWHEEKRYSGQRSMAFAIAKNIKKNGVMKRFGGKGSNFYSEVFNAEAFIDLRRRIIEKTANPEFIFQFIDPDKA